MKLSSRRFPDRVVRRRQLPGAFNDFGEFVAGAVEETTLRANVQPISNEDEDVVEGSRLDERLKVYVPEPDALVAAFEDRQADMVIVNGHEYVVEKSRSWRRSHTRAVVLR